MTVMIITLPAGWRRCPAGAAGMRADTLISFRFST